MAFREKDSLFRLRALALGHGILLQPRVLPHTLVEFRWLPFSRFITHSIYLPFRGIRLALFSLLHVVQFVCVATLCSRTWMWGRT